MMAKKNQPVWLSRNSFGNLVRQYREQMGMSQEDVATQWGYTREYVSLIERGKRKLDQLEQVSRLADILQIPHERLDAIGRGIPHLAIAPRHPLEADDAVLQALLTPAQATVKLSWLVWYADKEVVIVDNLIQTIASLEQAINDRRGNLLKPAQQVLAYAHEMMGKIEFDRLAYKEPLRTHKLLLRISPQTWILSVANLPLLAYLRKKHRGTPCYGSQKKPLLFIKRLSACNHPEQFVQKVYLRFSKHKPIHMQGMLIQVSLLLLRD